MAHKLLLSILYILVLLTYSRAQEHTGGEGEGETTAEVEPTPACAGPLEEIINSIEGIFGANYTVYINCLSFNGEGALEAGVASGESSTGGPNLRFVLGCSDTGGIITARSAPQSPLDTTNLRNTACLECNVNAAVGSCSENCADQCERCNGTATSCTRCRACVSLESSKCRTVTDPTNDCRSTCQGQSMPNHEQFNLCECNSPFVRNLLDYSAGRPEAEIECEGEDDPPPSTCDDMCTTRGHEFDNVTTQTCFACGIPYCVMCNSDTNVCLSCLRRTALYDHKCFACPLAPVAIAAHEQEEEVEEEERENMERQIALGISLPIVVILIIVFFVSMSIFAHHRYPHVSYHGQKRHRRPPTTERSISPGATLEDDDDQQPISHVWRPRPTIVLR